MRTLDQQYALDAHKRVLAVSNNQRPEEEQRRYGVMAHKLPILIHTSGLIQALEFVNSRKKDEYDQLLVDLWRSINSNDQEAHQQDSKQDKKAFLNRVREAELGEYMYLTQQVMAALVWYKRFAQSILDVDAAAQVEE